MVKILTPSLTLLLLQLAIRGGQAGDCDCTARQFTPPDFTQRKLNVRCNDLTTSRDFSCFGEFLNGLTVGDGIGLSITTTDTRLDVLLAQLLNAHHVTSLKCYFCTLSQTPYGSLCSKNLTALTLISSADLKLTSGGFQTCPLLVYLGLRGNDLAKVPPNAFQGLDSLVEMDLSNNRLLSVPQFAGIESTLEILDLSNNSIGSIAKNAFQGMRRLRILYLKNSKIVTIQEGAFDLLPLHVHVFVAGNPFHCDCALKWLPQWFEAYLNRTGFESWAGDEAVNPRCATPLEGLVRRMDFCSSTATTTELEQGSTLPVPLWLRFIMNVLTLV